MSHKLEYLDCTIRDGGYVNNWDFDLKLVRETYRALSKAGVDYVELGYHGTEKYFPKDKYGLFRFTPVETVNEVCNGISGAKVALMVDYGKYDIEDIATYKDSPVKLIRVAFHKTHLQDSIQSAETIQKMGFKVSLNLMGFSTYTNDERTEVLELLANSTVDYSYVADSYGSMLPNEMENFFSPLLKLKHITWGFHPHNNLQMAVANTLSAIDAGAQIVDGSIFGMGRGAGNLPTEIMLSFLQRKNPNKFNPIPVLNIIDHYYSELNQRMPWGYALPYMLSGVYGCHPDYAKDLIDRKEYDIEEIWKILESVTFQNPVGFSKTVMDDILKTGFYRKKQLVTDSTSATIIQSSVHDNSLTVPYINRHENTDFLVLAGGPQLQTQRESIKKFIKKYEPIVMGANFLDNLFVPDYHAFCNKRRFVDYIETVNPISKLLIGQYISNDTISEYTHSPHETIFYEDRSDVPFSINDGVINSNCRTVSLLLMGLAIAMGAKRIFVAGLDGYVGFDHGNRAHFYDEKDETESHEVLMDKHFGNLKYLEEIDSYMIKQGKEGIHILTQTAYSKFYKGIDNYL